MKDLADLKQFEASIKATTKAVVHFWAGWCEPCALLDAVLAQLEQDSPEVAVLRVEAEQASDVSERYAVAAVPLFLFFERGAECGRLEGADAAELTARMRALAGSTPVAAAPPQAAAAPAAGTALQARLRSLVRQHQVMLFMKGTPAEPRCGFSRQVVEALRATGLPFGTFDILGDDEVRQGLKAFSQWPTFPQLYAGGELVGGCDIVLELAAGGELRAELAKAGAAAVPAAPGAPPAQTEQLQARLEALVRSRDVMLFMKGSPAEPRCGFSRQVVEALRATGLPFGTFDILGDDEVRQGLKAFSQWPTFPQLYAGGELVGGCDIVLELAAGGELRAALRPQAA